MLDQPRSHRIEKMGVKQLRLFLIFFAGLVLSTSVLMLLIPVLFASPSSPLGWTAGVLGALAVVCGVCAIRLRPPRPGPAQG